MESHSTLPYTVEYAKSGRASCKSCKDAIAKDSLRMSRKTRSPFFDGFQDNWYHYSCFWKVVAKMKLKFATGDIKGLDHLKWDDQEKIRQKIDDGGFDDPNAVSDTPAGGSSSSSSKPHWTAEMAKSARSKCKQCNSSIAKDTAKVGTKKPVAWYHAECFIEHAAKLAFTDNPKDIEHIDELEAADRQGIIDALTVPEVKKEPSKRAATNGVASGGEPSAKVKRENSASADPKLAENRAQLKQQAEAMWALREELKANVHKQDLKQLLIHNNIDVPAGEDRVLDRLVDAMSFGVLEPCGVCDGGQLVWSTSAQAYRCIGALSEWAKCEFQTRNPKRRPFKINDEDFMENDWLAAYRKKRLSKKCGRRVGDESRRKLAAAKSADESVIPDSIYQKPLKSGGAYKSGGASSAGGSKSQKVTVKGGAVVDPECEVAEVVHVLKEKSTLWAVVLGKFQIETNSNSFYKLQLLEHDTRKKYYLYRAWGRIGSSQGGTKLENMDLDEAKDEFKRLYEEKSGNKWSQRENFKKQPGRMYPIDVDYGQPDEADVDAEAGGGVRSKLDGPTQELMRLIFDVDQMKRAMLEFEIDLNKMPLGRLSKKQISEAYSVLNQAANLMEKSASSVTSGKVREVTNHFFTLIPHDFGTGMPPLLDNAELIKQKMEMLEALQDIEVAYGLIKEGKQQHTAEHPIDKHYKSLNTQLKVIEKDDEVYKLIKQYMKNTHGATHNMKLKIVDLFEVKREGEDDRFAEYEKAENRQLLWHGSRATNYAGILSQGLRIAPPEAPVTGYMFGKGVYFADMVTKSANYCHPSLSKNEGILLLCEVSLGKMHEMKSAWSNAHGKLAAGYDSTKGVGRTQPDPKGDAELAGVKVPMGKGVTSPGNTSLLYNEYIVYKESQCKIRYLIRTKFETKSYF